MGKTTLVRCMARRSIPGFPLTVNVRYMQQEQVEFPQMTVLEFIFTDNSCSKDDSDALDRLIEEEKALQDEMDAADVTDEDLINALAEDLASIAEKIEKLQLSADRVETDHTSSVNGCGSSSYGRDYHKDFKEIYRGLSEDQKEVLRGLGFTKPLSKLTQNVSELSGGWQMRCILAQVLLPAHKSGPTINTRDLILLDEPTNHLDFESIRWLQEWLSKFSGMTLLISHDRSFLEGTCTDIVEMRNNTLEYFAGDYSAWCIHKDEMKHRAEHMVDSQQRQEERIRSQEISGAKKAKKLERAAMHSRLDGKKFKTQR